MLTLKFANYLLLNIQRLLGHKKLFGYPYYLVIDPSSVCQLRCPFCDGKLRPQVKMSLSDFKMVIDAIGKTCINLELYNWGEPFLNREIIDMINYASKKYRVYTRISSNLNLVNKDFYRALVLSRLNALTVSLDGASQETYGKYRANGSFDRVISNVKLLAHYKKYYKKLEPKLIWQFLVFRHNEHEIEKAKKMAKALSFNEIVFMKPHIPREHMDWDSTIRKFSNYSREHIGQYNLLPKTTNSKCTWPYSSVAVNANGSVSPCCAVAREQDDFANMSQDSFPEIWNCDNFIEAREYVFQNEIQEGSSNICARCQMKGTINFAPNLLQLLYYTISPLRSAWMKTKKFKITNY